MPPSDEETYRKLKDLALNKLLSGVPDADRIEIEQFLKKLEERSVSAKDAQAVLTAISQLPSPKHKRADRIVEILQTPPFYFFFGLSMIVVSFITTSFQLNSSLTFLVAMLGVAILLYGTGSQAAGTLGNATSGAQTLLSRSISQSAAANPPVVAGDGTPTPADPPTPAPTPPVSTPSGNALTSAAANIAIAGGAAVLTAFFGWGVVTYATDIRQVFRDYDQYSLVHVDFCSIDEIDCAREKSENQDSTSAATPPTQTIDSKLIRLIAQNAYLETGLGRRAFARDTGDGLEFIVFTRDLGKNRTVKLEAKTPDAGGLLYSANDDYFSIESIKDAAETAKCLSFSSGKRCMMTISVYEGDDGERVPRYVLEAAVTQASAVVGNEVIVSDPVVPE